MRFNEWYWLSVISMLAGSIAPAHAEHRTVTTAAQAIGNHNRIVLMGAGGCVDEAHIQQLRELGAVSSVNGPLDERQTIEKLKGANIAIANPFLVPMTRPVLEASDALRLIVLSITGFDRVDLDAAKARGISVTNMSDYSLEAVAEDTLALMLAVIRHIPQSDSAVRHGQYMTSPIEDQLVGFELSGKTLGVVGLGKIGTRVAEIARGFGMKTIAWDRNPKSIEGVTQVLLDELLAQSDVVSLNLALTQETAGILNSARLQLMKPTAVLVNTARAGLVDENALYAALRDGKLGGAGLDVLSGMNASNPLLTLDNVVVSPHVAYHSRESRIRCADTAVQTVRTFLASPKN